MDMLSTSADNSRLHVFVWILENGMVYSKRVKVSYGYIVNPDRIMEQVARDNSCSCMNVLWQWHYDEKINVLYYFSWMALTFVPVIRRCQDIRILSFNLTSFTLLAQAIICVYGWKVLLQTLTNMAAIWSTIHCVILLLKLVIFRVNFRSIFISCSNYLKVRNDVIKLKVQMLIYLCSAILHRSRGWYKNK